MNIILPDFKILTPIDRVAMLKQIETAARTCYKSECNITEESAKTLVKDLIHRGHLAMLEHVHITVRFICDRGISHEIVRHRLASYAQESTRYCNYASPKHDNQISVILPFFFDSFKPEEQAKYDIWKNACETCEAAYNQLIELGATPEQARTVLPTSAKTELVVTMNLREWRHFFDLRTIGTTGCPHPQMVELSCDLLAELSMQLPEIFLDQYTEYESRINKCSE